MIELPDRKIDVPKYHDVTLSGLTAHTVWVVDDPGVVTVNPWDKKKVFWYRLKRVLLRKPPKHGIIIENCTLMGNQSAAIKVVP